MAPSRQPKDNDALGNPSNVVPGGGGASGVQIVDIYQRLAGIERSVTYLEARASDFEEKVGGVAAGVGDLGKEVAAAKATFRTLQWVFGIIGSLIIIGLGFVGTLTTMAIKHYLRW